MKIRPSPVFQGSLALAALLLASPAASQRDTPTETPGKLEIAKHPLTLEPPVGPQAPKFDTAKLSQEAEDLAKLAQSVPADVSQIAHGKLPKDTSDKLKHIEKLAKHLRSELTP